MAKLSVKELLDLKGVRQIAFVQVARGEEAIAAAAAGMDMIGTGFRPETRDFPSLVPESHFQFGLAWGRHASAQEALREAMQAMEAGAESIYCAMSPAVVEVLAREGVPVIAHVGLVPPKATWVGGMRAVGRSAKQAGKVFSGQGCDATYLFSADLLGENRGHIPRHAKVYRNFAQERDCLQQERISAYREYIDDIGRSNFPQAAHNVGIDESEFEAFIKSIK
jgi:3-methyl-2-oxobutanoate hydroxymethyltransferase